MIKKESQQCKALKNNELGFDFGLEVVFVIWNEFPKFYFPFFPHLCKLVVLSFVLHLTGVSGGQQESQPTSDDCSIGSLIAAFVGGISTAVLVFLVRISYKKYKNE